MKIHTVTMPDGTTATRTSEGREYKFAVVHVRTEEEVRLAVQKLDANIANAEHDVETLTARRSPEDKAEYAAALAEHDFLHEKVLVREEPDPAQGGKLVPIYEERWLTDAFRVEIGESENAPYRQSGGALDRVLKNGERIAKTIERRLENALSSVTGSRRPRSARARSPAGRRGGTSTAISDSRSPAMAAAWPADLAPSAGTRSPARTAWPRWRNSRIPGVHNDERQGHQAGSPNHWDSRRGR
jgi:hypothetical protein